MNQEQAGLIMLAVAVVALGLVAWGWWNRKRKHADWAQHLVTQIPTSIPTSSLEGLYIATTEESKPLERIAFGPLAFRSKVGLFFHPEGIVFDAPGSSPFLIPTSADLQAGLATWTIDRVVEPGGMVMIRWSLGPHQVDSYFRVTDSQPSALVDAVNQLRELVR